MSFQLNGEPGVVGRGDSKERQPLGQRHTEWTLREPWAVSVTEVGRGGGCGIGIGGMPISSSAPTLCVVPSTSLPSPGLFPLCKMWKVILGPIYCGFSLEVGGIEEMTCSERLIQCLLVPDGYPVSVRTTSPDPHPCSLCLSCPLMSPSGDLGLLWFWIKLSLLLYFFKILIYSFIFFLLCQSCLAWLQSPSSTLCSGVKN